ncbi:MraY family glycosyltransferase [Psychrobacillus sp.]|uniref:glycosyltransferase family 4 protein n=1 Tax=Psychrobacillus sp. TaxID=1871623 RepID=UPI0028BE2AC8|nr:MraY family glycosyltransferase [Psychrobacillus sp.]
MDIKLLLAFIVSMATAIAITPLVIKLAHIIGAVDKPSERKVHANVMPRLGGLAIFIAVVVGYFVAGLYEAKITGIIVGALIIIVLGIIDDKYELSAKIKLLGQILAACAVMGSGLTIEVLNIPFLGVFHLGIFSYVVTLIWILAITNAINLIDGLDGLSAGISSIVFASIAFLAFSGDKMLILSLSLILLGSTLGFLFHNFYPAKIFMGDTGSMFLGYSISILSLLGLYKSVTLFSFVVPIMILGVPIFDTSFAIIRRLVNRQPIHAADKSHLHHRLLALGLSHRDTVLVIYGFGLIFSITAITFETLTLRWAIFIVVFILIAFEIIAEKIGLVNEEFRPIISIFRKVVGYKRN